MLHARLPAAPSCACELTTHATAHTQACGAGRRAAKAASLLEASGYSGLKIFKEGWTGWAAAGLPQEKGE